LVLEISKEFDEVLECDIARGGYFHDVDQDIPEYDVVIGVLEVTLVEFTELVFIHISEVGVFLCGSCIDRDVLLKSLKSFSMRLVDLMSSRSGTTSSSKKVLMAFCRFHLWRVRN
jgi:hypothetical protein